MKAFTVYQPYAHAIVAGVKHYETRPRRTHIRGRVAVHAGRLDEVQATKHLTNGEFWAVLEAAAEEAERFRETAMILAERAGVSAEEAIYRIQEALQVIRDEITSIADTLTNAVEKFITQVEEDIAQAEPKHRRRKRQRERAALIERRYMVQIRHYERARPFRRVYKPP